MTLCTDAVAPTSALATKRHWGRRLIGLGIGLVALGWLADYVLDFRYLVRMMTYPDRPVTDVSWYVPLQVVPGAPETELPTAAPRDALLWLDHAGGTPKTFAYLFATTRDFGRIGQMLLNRGEFNGRQIVPADWIAEMIKPSPLEPDYGLQIWLGNRGRRMEGRDEPLLVDDCFYLDGHAKQRVYVVPSKDLVIVRVGEQARHWDESRLVNEVVRGIPQH